MNGKYKKVAGATIGGAVGGFLGAVIDLILEHQGEDS